MEISALLARGISDELLFPLLQLVLVLFVLCAMFQDWLGRRRAGKGSTKLTVTRGETSMNKFYGTYAGIIGIIYSFVSG